MAIDPRRLLLLRDVARAGSISAAARAVGWTQPAVSQHLARLERDAGGPLLLRGPAGVTPTEAGRALLRRADVVAAELHAAEEELAALHGLRGGRVRLVAFPSAAATLVPRALGALAAAHPDVEVGLEQAEPPEALAAVAAGDADLALVFGYDGPPAGLGALAWRPVLEEPVHLVLPPGPPGPAEAADLADLAELADEDWIGGCVRCRTHLVERCEAAGFTPTVRHSSDDYVVVQNLVARGLGVTVLPASALAAYRHPAVRVVPLAALGRRHVGVAHRPGADAVPAFAALVAEVMAAGREQPRPALR
ncbi:LysR family transcriptional regulator [Nocardioides sp. SOB77]|uniref:LysR family transcriptional regulator n=1 Tax=Nocardioides oceani TaxID=3058369 RepID=A0ABT8FFZ1_9ACTN|nr:LysR family transcriptional regulator [Nocardioides oceani]MDN4173455.1 LysR family transcriptional regulator [Nocardioides oceani]